MTQITFETYWKGGRRARQRAIDLTRAIEAAAHTLAYATQAGAGGAEAPIYTYEHLGNLYGGTDHLAEALDRMADRLADMKDRGVLTHDSDGNAQLTAMKGMQALREAATSARALTTKLQAAQNAISPLGMTREAAQAVGAAYGDDDEQRAQTAEYAVDRRTPRYLDLDPPHGSVWGLPYEGDPPVGEDY